MNKPLFFGVLGCLALVLALPLFMNQDPPAQPAPAPAEAPAPPAAPAPDPGGQDPGWQEQNWQVQPTQPQSYAQPTPNRQQPAAPQNMTAAQLTNTVWQVPTEYGQAKVTLYQGGKVGAKIGVMPQISGNWQVSGNRLNVTVSFMGKTERLNCQIQGQNLYYNGHPAQRLR